MGNINDFIIAAGMRWYSKSTYHILL